MVPEAQPAITLGPGGSRADERTPFGAMGYRAPASIRKDPKGVELWDVAGLGHEYSVTEELIFCKIEIVSNKAGRSIRDTVFFPWRFNLRGLSLLDARHKRIQKPSEESGGKRGKLRIDLKRKRWKKKRHLISEYILSYFPPKTFHIVSYTCKDSPPFTG